MYSVTKTILVALLAVGISIVNAHEVSAAQGRLNPNQITSPQVVAGDIGTFNYVTQIDITSTHNAACPITIDYHMGAGTPPSTVPLTDGQNIGDTFGRTVPAMGRVRLNISGPPGEHFIGAATANLSGDCAQSLGIQTSYTIRDGGGALQETFSYQEQNQTGINQCLVFPLNLDPDGTDGKIETAGLAMASDQPLTNVNRCTDLFNGNGVQIGPTVCDAWAGGHEAFLVDERHPGIVNPVEISSFRACFLGPRPTVSPPPVIDSVALGINAEPDVTQFRTAGQTRKVPACMPGPNTACVNNGRCRVETNWFVGGPISQATVEQADQDSASFFFNDPNNLELLAGVLDGCAVDGHYWVFFAGSTNIQFDLMVTDTQTGSSRVYNEPPGGIQPILDTRAFATCP